MRNSTKTNFIKTGLGLGVILLALILFPRNEEFVVEAKKDNNVENKQKIVSIKSNEKIEIPKLKNYKEISDILKNENQKINEDERIKISEDLKYFANIKQKIFTSESEDTQRKNLIHDKLLIQNTGKLLRQTTISFSDIDASVDFLLDSFQTGDREASWNEILLIVNDNKLEDTSLPVKTREELAGIKGEIMFQVSALAPQSADYFDTLSLSPATLQIWKNVKEKQNENYLISLEEKNAHER